MSSVLVLGSTGTVGLGVAIAFANEGYKVYGLARTQEKANLLIKNEIVPVLSSEGIKDTSKWVSIAESVDVIVEAIMDFTDQTGGGETLEQIKLILQKYPKKTILYTSGGMLYGDHGDQLIHENSNYKTHEFLIPRLKIQSEYQRIGAIVIQPSFVHGTTLPIYYKAIKAATQDNGIVTLPGNDQQWRGFIHIKDLAQFYVLVSKRAAEFKGDIFLINSSNEKVSDVIFALAKASKVTINKINWTAPTDLLSTFLATSQKESSQKATNLLGWYPVQENFTDGAPRYIAAFELLSNKETTVKFQSK
ncbi:hypothetical protein DLAC_09681 [Tieghemostelium lacteum]|uniref:NAD-dependent epimerase/dehydratase domain-containing protein n=1 Tax=Tieghemostelium lacteum TaxID=361077 RepID=A0A151Z6X6_TIELA|nr:hypothetical protein DLAC_09681 [Tieghemostelium lacteum]|eukprot:KYQ89713.1 hypothetical protein DLAC_09681 [Tieghemostelium lacteum]